MTRNYTRVFMCCLLAVALYAQSLFSASCSDTRRGSDTSLDCSDCPLRASGEFTERNTKQTRTEGVGTPFLPRPQGLNSAALFNPFYYGCGQERPCGSFALQYRYNQIFREERLARCLFGSESLHFTGSKVAHPGKGTFLADNFGLPPDFEGTLKVKPSIKNNIVDIMARVELGSWLDCFVGAYVAVNASVVHTSWKLHPCESKETATSDRTFSSFPFCYMSTSTATTVEGAGDIQTALSGDFLFGDMQSAWRFGRFELDHERERRDTKLANIDLLIGYDYVAPCFHVGAFIKGVAPTGTKPDSRTVFQAIAGNGHHWELGGGLDAHYDLWSCGDHCLAGYLNGCVTHLFKDTQWRTFDFRDVSPRSRHRDPGFFSRYLLLKEFDVNGDYANRLINGVNFTTRRIKSSFDVQGDASLRLVYHLCGLAVGVGYNVYGRSRENVSGPCECCPEFTSRRFGIKGINGVCARGFTHGEGLNGEVKILSSTSSKARIFNNKETLSLVDNPVSLDEPLFVNWDSPASPVTPAEDLIVAIDSEIDGLPAPVILTDEDLDIKRVPGQLTHKVFAHIDYQWEDCDDWQPYVGVGGEVEFADSNDACKSCTANQWGAWFRLGANF